MYIFGSLLRKIWFTFGSSFRISAARPYPNQNREPPGSASPCECRAYAHFVRAGHIIDFFLYRHIFFRLGLAPNLISQIRRTLITMGLYSLRCGRASKRAKLRLTNACIPTYSFSYIYVDYSKNYRYTYGIKEQFLHEIETQKRN